MSRRGILIVISGFSGAGKGTIISELVKTYENYALSISMTTRSPRKGETHGKEYFFITKDEFEDMIQKKALIEYAKYVNNYYGTPKQYVQDQLEAGQDVILEIETQGALNIKRQFPDAVLIFVAPPSAEVLKSRLVGRGTEEESVIHSRLETAVKESCNIEEYDYLLINDQVLECVSSLHNIIKNEHKKVSRNLERIQAMKNELNIFAKGE